MAVVPEQYWAQATRRAHFGVLLELALVIGGVWLSPWWSGCEYRLTGDANLAGCLKCGWGALVAILAGCKFALATHLSVAGWPPLFAASDRTLKGCGYALRTAAAIGVALLAWSGEPWLSAPPSQQCKFADVPGLMALVAACTAHRFVSAWDYARIAKESGAKDFASGVGVGSWEQGLGYGAVKGS